jgi:hypothetical protein
MKLPFYLENQLAAYGCPVEHDVDPMAARDCIPGWGITVIAKMPQKEMMKAGVILGHQMVLQADRFLVTIDKSCCPVTGI